MYFTRESKLFTNPFVRFGKIITKFVPFFSDLLVAFNV